MLPSYYHSYIRCDIKGTQHNTHGVVVNNGNFSELFLLRGKNESGSIASKLNIPLVSLYTEIQITFEA